MSIACALLLLPLVQDAAPKKRPPEVPLFDKARVEALVDRLGREALDTHATPGLVIAIAKDHEVVIERAFGVGGVDGKTALTPASRFRIGTLERQFIAVGVLRLVDAKALSLDDTLAKLWPTFPTGGRAVTLAHLLANTSGLPSVEAILARNPNTSALPLSRAAFAALFADATWTHEPGAGFELETAGWSVLAEILAQRSGEAAQSYAAAHLFKPLGLANTAYQRELDAPQVLDARGQTRLEFRHFAPVLLGDDSNPDGPTSQIERAAIEAQAARWPGNVLVSNAHDLVRWQKALVDRAVFSERASRLIMSPTQLADGNSTHYGFAIEMSRLGEFKCYAATGTTADMPIVPSAPNGAQAGVSSAPVLELARLAYYSLPHVTVVVLANGTQAPAERIERAIGRAILGVPEPTALDVPLAADDVARLVGTYRIGAALHAIEKRAERLVCRSTSEGEHVLLHQGGFVFAWFDEPDVHLAFELENGAAAKFVRTRRGFASTARRVEADAR